MAEKGSKGAGKGKGKNRGKGRNRMPEKFLLEGKEIVAVRRNLLQLHPDVEARQESECEKIRERYSILATHGNSEDAEPIPKIMERLEYLPFPDWMKDIMARQCIEAPTPIQMQAWPAALQGCDIAAVAGTGSGKTLAYTLPLLIHVMMQPAPVPHDGPIGLVLVPTRILCEQVAEVINSYGRKIPQHPDFKCINADADDLATHGDEVRRRCEIMVTTPGQLLKLLDGRKTKLNRATFLVLDEADELIDKFNEQVSAIVEAMRPDRQALLFSASWPDKVADLAPKVMQFQPLTITVGDRDIAACENIEQRFWRVGHRNELDQSGTEPKRELLCRNLKQVKDQLSADYRVLIFVNKKEDLSGMVSLIREQLEIENTVESYGADCTRGSEERKDQAEVFKRFTSDDGDCFVLVTTQVLGRGLDNRSIRRVINFDMPAKIVEYIHRIGRTGRAGEQGYAMTLLEDHDMVLARSLKRCLKKSKQKIPHWIEDGCNETKMDQARKARARRQLVSNFSPDPDARSHTEPPPCPSQQSESDWKEYWSVAYRRPFWHNACTNESSWKLPDTAENPQRPATKPTRPDDAWEIAWDDNHQRDYWYHPVTKQTTWVKPREEGATPAVGENPPSHASHWESWEQYHEQPSRSEDPPVARLENPAPAGRTRLIAHIGDSGSSYFSVAEGPPSEDSTDSATDSARSALESGEEYRIGQVDRSESAWNQYYDSDSRRHFWHNRVTKETTWTDPCTRLFVPFVQNTTGPELNRHAVLRRVSHEAPSTRSSFSVDSEGIPVLRDGIQRQAETASLNHECPSSRSSPSAAADVAPVRPESIPDVASLRGEDWEEHFDITHQRPYWHNRVTKKSQWDRPLLPESRPQPALSTVQASTQARAFPSRDLCSQRPCAAQETVRQASRVEAAVPARSSPDGGRSASSSCMQHDGGWVRYFSSDHKQHYWYNRETRQSSWTEPQEVAAARLASNRPPSLACAAPSDYSSRLRAMSGPVAMAPERNPERAASSHPEFWKEYYDDESKRHFWYNTMTRKSEWTKPAEVADMSAVSRSHPWQ